MLHARFMLRLSTLRVFFSSRLACPFTAISHNSGCAHRWNVWRKEQVISLLSRLSLDSRVTVTSPTRFDASLAIRLRKSASEQNEQDSGSSELAIVGSLSSLVNTFQRETNS